MWLFWTQWAPVWAPEGSAGGETTGNAAPADAPPGAGEQPPDGGASPEGDSGGTAAGGSPSSIMDFKPQGDAPKDGEAWKAPEGMEIPEHMVGSTAEDTLSKVLKAYTGARQELSTRQRDAGVLEGTVPKAADGYTFDSLEVDPEKDAVLKDLTSEESKPIIDAGRKVAHQLGIPDKAFASFMYEYSKELQAQGLSFETDPESSAQIRGEAEMEDLVAAYGKNGADQMLRQIDTYAQKLAANGILQSQQDVDEFSQMIGTKRGLEIFHKILTVEFGEQAIPPGDPVEGDVTLEQAYAMKNEAMQMRRGADRDEAMQRAEAALSKALKSSSSTGAVRSRVL